MPHLKKSPTEEIIYLYNDGYSCEDIAKMYNMSRQAIHERLKRNDVKMRTKKLLPFIMYDGIKFTISATTGYYRNTDRTSRGHHISLHRYKYECENNVILPLDWDVHHIDSNKLNNDIDNLQALSKSDHTKLHHKAKK